MLSRALALIVRIRQRIAGTSASSPAPQVSLEVKPSTEISPVAVEQSSTPVNMLESPPAFSKDQIPQFLAVKPEQKPAPKPVRKATRASKTSRERAPAKKAKKSGQT
jgi:hypothetical protein